MGLAQHRARLYHQTATRPAQPSFVLRTSLSQEVTNGRFEVNGVLVGVAAAKHPVGGWLGGVCTTWYRGIAVLEAQWGDSEATPLCLDEKGLSSVVTEQCGLLVGSEQDSILGKDQTQGAW